MKPSTCSNEAIADLVPAEIVNRPKQGFGVPIQHWINQQLRERIRDTLNDPRTLQRGYVSPQSCRATARRT